VTVIGQAGVGKSRLLRESAQLLAAQEPAPVLREGRCLPYGSSIVYWPLSEVLRAECEIVDGDPAEAAWEKLSGHLSELLAAAPADPGESPERKVALIGRLLGIGEHAETADPQDPQ
ncbi:MAG TPA: ATP-binding protein, partial [Solirubrobacteraceae bacterium]